MTHLFRLPGASRDDACVAAWFADERDELKLLARDWFDRIRSCGCDVNEILHDGQPTACVGDAAFAYVAAYSEHVNVGFFHGADLPDPAGLLEGSGKRMRHVKLRRGLPLNEAALEGLLAAAHEDITARVATGEH